MSNHQQLPQDIRKQISDFESKLNNMKTLKGQARNQAISLREKQLKRIKRIMDTYQYSIQSGAFQGKVATHKSQYKEFQLQINRLEKNLEVQHNDNGTEEDLFKHRTKSNKNIDSNNRQLVIEAGNHAQKQSKEAAQRILRQVGEMDQRADLIVTELDRQINKLDQIYEELNDTQSTLKRAEKHLKYFAKQIYTDRLMICLIIVIALAILVIIILAIAGKTPKAMKGTVS